MLVMFRCEHCGKQFQLDERYSGKRGRCSHCGQIMRIPSAGTADPGGQPADERKLEGAAAGEPQPPPEPEPPFRLTPPEPHPRFGLHVPVDPAVEEPAQAPLLQHPPGRHDPVFAHEHADRAAIETHGGHPPARFELLEDEIDAGAAHMAAPEVERGVRELEEFQKNREGYDLAVDHGNAIWFFGRGGSGPAGWVRVKWRAGVGRVLKVLRWIDDWAYLISVPFVVLMIFGIVVEHRGFVHAGAVVVVLANYGRFWTDLLALFVRPFKDGPLQGIAFLFPPYTLYYLASHWHKMKPILRRIATSCIPIVLVVLAYGFLPSVNPAAKDVEGFVPKLKAGAAEVETEIRSDLKTLEGEILERAPAPK
jgi:hypothetical protein